MTCHWLQPMQGMQDSCRFLFTLACWLLLNTSIVPKSSTNALSSPLDRIDGCRSSASSAAKQSAVSGFAASSTNSTNHCSLQYCFITFLHLNFSLYLSLMSYFVHLCSMSVWVPKHIARLFTFVFEQTHASLWWCCPQPTQLLLRENANRIIELGSNI